MRNSRWLPPRRLVDKNTELLRLAKDRSVLHVGMGGFIDDPEMTATYVNERLEQSLHVALSKVAGRLVGIDVNPVTIKAMRERVPGDYHLADVTTPGLDIGERFDVIVFGDVIEHLDDFKSSLANLRRHLKPDGVLAISTVNAFGFDAIVKMLFGYEAGHEEHTCYFSWMTMKRLVEMNDLEMVDFAFLHRFDVKKFNSLPHRIGHYVSGLVARLMPQYSMGLIAIVKPA